MNCNIFKSAPIIEDLWSFFPQSNASRNHQAILPTHNQPYHDYSYQWIQAEKLHLNYEGNGPIYSDY